MKKAVSGFLVCALFGGAAAAHEFFVMPHEAKGYKAGDTVQLDVLSTHYFTVGEELEEPSAVNEVYILRNGQKSALLPLEKNADKVWYQAAYTLPDDAPAVAVGRRVGGFYCLFTDGSYAEGTKAEAAAAQPGKTLAKARFFEKFSKNYLNPDPYDAGFSAPLGHTLEILPLDNPAKIKLGSKPRFRVLFKGQPLARADVSATYDYYDYKTADAYAQTGKTDAKGDVSFKIDHRGLWLIRASDTRKSAHPDTDEDNNAAIVVFTVK
jgi:uncharacterized GH25 family protein